MAADCISDAEAEIDKRLAVKFDVDGWTTNALTPPAVQTICKWLAIAYIHEATARGSKDAYARADRYLKKANDNLQELVDGTATLVDSTGALVNGDSDENPVYCNTTNYTPTFNEDDQKNWATDADKLDDIADERD